MKWASKENNVTYMGQDLYKQIKTTTDKKLDRRTDMRKVPDVPGNKELFVNSHRNAPIPTWAASTV